MTNHDQGSDRRARLASARLYLVCPSTARSGSGSGSGSARSGSGSGSGSVRSGSGSGGGGAGDRSHADGNELAGLLRGAIAGGVDVVQLRDEHLSDEALVGVANAARALCERLGALLIVNDRPLLAREAGADGVHVGQHDMPVAEVRELVGPDMLVGLSTHAPAEIDATDAALVDYIGVGPIHETPTKPGRPAVGLELIRYALAHAPVPFFAIGGLRAGNIVEAIHAGASRVCVLRAIADAEDPERAARALRDRLDAHPLGP